MRKLLVTLLSLAAMAAVVSPASAAGLTGSYNATITGKAPQLNGKWQIKFLSGNKADVYRNGTRLISTAVSFSGNKMKLTTASSSGRYNQCTSGAQKSGTYTYRLSGKKLTFKAVSDTCAGRKASLTTKPFVKA